MVPSFRRSETSTGRHEGGALSNRQSKFADDPLIIFTIEEEGNAVHSLVGSCFMHPIAGNVFRSMKI